MGPAGKPLPLGFDLSAFRDGSLYCIHARGERPTFEVEVSATTFPGALAELDFAVHSALEGGAA